MIYAQNSIDITTDIVALYDKNTPAPAGAAKPATAPPAAAKPVATPPAKPTAAPAK